METLLQPPAGINSGQLQSAAPKFDLPEDIDRKNFLFFRANYFHLFGAVSEAEYAKLFRAYWQAKEQNKTDFLGSLDDVMEGNKVIDAEPAIALARKQAVIFSSFHFGPYNLLGVVLSQMGINFSVLANDAVNMDAIRNHTLSKFYAKELTNEIVVLDESDVIQPGQMSTMLACLSKLRSGRSLLVYGDGLEGQTSYFDRRKLLQVDFLGRKLYARRGVASLAYKLGVPVVPVMLNRVDGKVVTQFFPAIDPADYASREDFVFAYCQTGYHHLEAYVKKDPTQWEIVDHLQMYLPGNGQAAAPAAIDAINPTPFLRFNDDRFGLFLEQGKYHLLDRDERNVFGITTGLAKLLPRLTRPIPSETVQEVFPKQLLNDLRLRQIITPALMPAELMQVS